MNAQLNTTKKTPADDAGRAKFDLFDGCNVAAFAGFAKPEAVFSTANEDGHAPGFLAP